jgi:hypothetical protein
MYQTWYRTGSQAGSSPDIYTAEYFIPLSKNSSEEMIINIYYNKTSRSTSENLKTVDQMLSTIQYAQ